MSQKTVHLLIGRLLTDEDFRQRFIDRPLETLLAWRDQGFDLTNDEIDALLENDRRIWASMAKRIPLRLQRSSLRPDGRPHE